MSQPVRQDERALMRVALDHAHELPRDWPSVPGQNAKRLEYLLCKWAARGWLVGAGWSIAGNCKLSIEGAEHFREVLRD